MVAYIEGSEKVRGIAKISHKEHREREEHEGGKICFYLDNLK
jgi:hypothetical protein